MKFGLALPTYSWPELDLASAGRIKTIARRAEELGFDSLWTIEHFIVAPGLYGVSWLSTLTTLAHVAAVTERVDLGTSILIAALRNPIILAKELATLQYLAGGRLRLGVGVGWDEREFAAIGVPLRERGGRTDEMIAVLRRLLTERRVTHHGRYYHFDDVTIDPPLDRFPPLWIAGGGKLETELSPDSPVITTPVLRRVLGADAWIARAAGDDATVQADIGRIRAFLAANGRDPATLHFSHLNFYHLPASADREAALAEQRPLIERVMGSHRSYEHLQRCYLLGTTSDIRQRIAGLAAAGLDSMIVAPLTYDIAQVERFAAEVMPTLAAAAR